MLGSYIAFFVFYVVASAFRHEQALYARDFKGESHAFCMSIWASVYVNWAVSLFLLYLIGSAFSWVAAGSIYLLSALATGILAGIISATARRKFGDIGPMYVMLFGFFISPAGLASAYFSVF